MTTNYNYFGGLVTNGLVLDVSTDCVSCVFPDNFPFELNQDMININGYYYDDANTIHKYKLEKKEERLKVERLPKYIRKDTYFHNEVNMKIHSDVEDNDFADVAADYIHNDDDDEVVEDDT